MVVGLYGDWFEKTVVRRAFVFNGGTFDYDMGHMTYGYNMGRHLTVVTVFLLLETDSGYVLFDTGWSRGMVPVLESIGLNPSISEENDVLRCLDRAGVSRDDISMIVLSHLHLDHAGGLSHFKGKRALVQKDELSYARSPHGFAAVPYARLDWEFGDYEWEEVEGDKIIDHGLALVMLHGHTPGTMGIMFHLQKSGTFLFTGDNCYLLTNIENELIPGSVWSPAAAWYSLRKIKFLAALTGARPIPSHDGEVYGRLIPFFPEYLE
ncbi:MAG: N-acyl homoserine lactonase family protein [Actinomycetota bacterium]